VSLEERGANQFLGPTTVLDEVGNEVTPASALKPEESSGILHAPLPGKRFGSAKYFMRRFRLWHKLASHDPSGEVVLEGDHSTPVCLSIVKHPTTQAI
jgi:hypothetical protein